MKKIAVAAAMLALLASSAIAIARPTAVSQVGVSHTRWDMHQQVTRGGLDTHLHRDSEGFVAK